MMPKIIKVFKQKGENHTRIQLNITRTSFLINTGGKIKEGMPISDLPEEDRLLCEEEIRKQREGTPDERLHVLISENNPKSFKDISFEETRCLTEREIGEILLNFFEDGSIDFKPYMEDFKLKKIFRNFMKIEKRGYFDDILLIRDQKRDISFRNAETLVREGLR